MDTTLIVTLITVLIGSLIGYLSQRAQKLVFNEAQQKIVRAESKVEAEPAKAKPAWDLARATLEAYFNRNLSQVSYIFWLSVVVMFMGFIVVVYGVLHGINHPDDIKPATITALSGIITEFIGATFLFIYRSTITQAINY